MAQILEFPKAASRKAAVCHTGPCEVVLFPGVRVEYHEDQSTVDLARRYRAERQKRPARTRSA